MYFKPLKYSYMKSEFSPGPFPYSGNLYHNGETSSALASFTQGDYITVILDMDARTLAFAKNSEVGLFAAFVTKDNK